MMLFCHHGPTQFDKLSKIVVFSNNYDIAVCCVQQ